MHILDWSWGPDNKLGLGAALGIGMFVGSVVLIILNETTDIFRKPKPPAFQGDWIPDHQNACHDYKELGLLQEAKILFEEDLSWPIWPDLDVVTCDYVHGPSPTGTITFRSCNSLRRTRDGDVIPCPMEGLKRVPGATYTNVDANGMVRSIDVYTNFNEISMCSPAHEYGHARGLRKKRDEEVPGMYVISGHTEKPGHLMGTPCGFGTKWLDRGPDGDWPY